MKVPITLAALVGGLVLVTGSVAVAGPAVPGSGPGGGPVAAKAPVPPPAAVPAPAQQAAQHRPAHRATVTLVTGDRIRLDENADGSASTTPLSAGVTSAATYMQFSWSGDRYVIPSAAVPYLGSTLDLRLFDVSYLARAGLDDAHQASLPVTVTTTGGAAPALPGVHVTHTSGTKATATIGKSGAGQLGRHLAQQWRDARTGASNTAVGTLPGISKISLARPYGAPALPEALPRTPQQAMTQAAAHGIPANSTGAAPATTTVTAATTTATQGTAQVGPNGSAARFHTLTFDPIDRTGGSGTAVGFLTDLDDPQVQLFIVGSEDAAQGPVSFSVPEGHYSAEISVFTGPATTPGDRLTTESALVVKPDITVDSDQTVTLDARTAVPFTSTLQTPLPAGYAREDVFTFQRLGPTGTGARVQAFGFDGIGDLTAMRLASEPDKGNIPLWATPTGPVTTGTLRFNAITTLAPSADLTPDAPDPQHHPRYYLTFPSDNGIPSSLTYEVPDSQLTALHSKIYAVDCAACTASIVLFPLLYLPWSQNELGIGAFVQSGEQTDYLYSTDPDHSIWQQNFNSPDGSRRTGQRLVVTPGQQIDDAWGNTTYGPSPSAPFGEVPLLGDPGAGSFTGTKGAPSTTVIDRLTTVCVACRQGDISTPNIQILGDTGRNHHAEIIWETGPVLRFWRDGTLALSSESEPGGELNAGAPLPLLHKPATYKLQWAWKPTTNPTVSSDTTWTFHSGPDDTSTLPKPLVCAPDPGQACSFLPLLFTTYDLPLDFHSSAKAGAPFQLAFDVSGQQGAPAPTGVSASVQVSYDDGTTWSDPRSADSLGDGKFGLTVDHPDLAATSGAVSLRIHAQDAAGNAVDQTTIRAYGLSS